MRDWAGYATRNPGQLLITLVDRQPSEVTKFFREQSEMRKAMYQHRKLHPTCYVTGLNKIAVHHIVPVCVDPSLAWEPSNFISLHPTIHKYLAHGGYYKNHCPNIVEVCDWLKDNMEIVVTQKPKLQTIFGVPIR